MMTSEKVGIALLGLGRIGQVHLKILRSNPRVQLLCVVEENIDFAVKVLKEHGLHGQLRIVPNNQLAEVLQDPNVQGVYVCTPTDTHTALVRRALAAKKAVFCEKPLSENLEDIIACYDDAEKYGATLFCAFNRHFDPGIRGIYNKAQAGDLGKLHMVKATFHDTPLWMGAPSFSQTFLVHDVDLLCWFADQLPETVVVQASANIKEVADKDDVDTVGILMRFPCGMLGIFDFSRYSPYGYDVRLEVSGSKGMQLADVRAKTFPERFHDAYSAELNHFLDVLQGKAELHVKREYSERVGIVMEAIKESYKTGQVVHLKK